MSGLAFDKARALLEQSRFPLIFYDDDADGLCSAILLYRHYKKGHCIALRNTAEQIRITLPRKLEEYNADLVVFVDKASLPEDIFASIPQTIWIDHHEPQKVPNTVVYINPQTIDPTDNRPTTHWVYELINRPASELWLAECGVVSDWQITDLHDDFRKQYPQMVGNARTPPELLFTTPLGKLIAIIGFNLHGKSEDIKKSVSALLKIQSFEEILFQTSPPGKFLHKRYDKFKKEYDALYADVKANARQSANSLVYTYTEMHTSFTSYLSNQLLFENPGKLIVIARIKNNSYKCSFRITPPHQLSKAMATVFTRFPGEGGGHAQACGAKIPEAVFFDVVAAIEQELFS